MRRPFLPRGHRTQDKSSPARPHHLLIARDAEHSPEAAQALAKINEILGLDPDWYER
jgi:hypothetical protein